MGWRGSTVLPAARVRDPPKEVKTEPLRSLLYHQSDRPVGIHSGAEFIVSHKKPLPLRLDSPSRKRCPVYRL